MPVTMGDIWTDTRAAERPVVGQFFYHPTRRDADVARALRGHETGA